MATWRHRALALLAHLGIESTDLGAGAVLLTRRGSERSIESVDADAWLVRRPGTSPSAKPPPAESPPPPAPAVSEPNVGRRAAPSRRRQRSTEGQLADEHVAWIVRELDINCVIDVGANVGQFGRRLRRNGYRGRIVSFEPVREYADELRAVASRGDDWHVYDYALGDADGESEIYARPGAMSSLLPSSDFGEAWHPRLRIARKESIRIRRLDGVFDDAVSGLEEPRVFLKLDTQGYDLKAFSGAGDRIQDVRGMQSEVSCVPIYEGMPRMAEQITVYENAGFEITGMFPVTRDPATLRVIEFDVVMVRPDAVRSA